MPQAASAALLDREQAILAFNRRVLAQASRPDVPLLERLRYVCIVSSNLDEFFEVRFADLLDAARDRASGVGQSDVDRVGHLAHELIDDQYAVFNEQLVPLLSAAGIAIRNHAERDKAQRRWVARFFEREVRPLLVPVSLDPSHPFPQVANKALHFIVRLAGQDALGREGGQIAIVKVPRVLPRVVKLPPEVSQHEQLFVLLSSVVRAHLGELFPGREVVSFSQFRVTRDSDIEVDEEAVVNLRHAVRSRLTTRHFGRAVRLEVVKSCPEDLARLLLRQFELPEAALYHVNGPVNLVRLNQLIDQCEAPLLRFAPHEPVWPQGRLPRGQSIFEVLRERDVMLHHPFESFDPVVELLRQAVDDPRVLAIKQTIYRAGSRSQLMDLLMEAARRGKEVLAVVELKARFDEEANVNWAERLEAAGAQVVYGIVGLKTHGKLLLVTRSEGKHQQRLRRYLHLSTGNYNPGTARFYTDLGLLTADPALTADADAVFNLLASGSLSRRMHKLVLAPFEMHKRWLFLLHKVREAAAAGHRARVVAKFNSLTDVDLIEALLACGQAGAQIDLIVRGACRLPPGVPGVSENIRVRSVVGRFLEHTRVFYFAWGSSEAHEALYLASADWMSRNMHGRIELAWPVTDPKQRQRVIDEALVPYLHDACDAWALQADGRYLPLSGGPSAQQALMQRYAER